MEINTTDPVNSQVKALETAPKVSEVKREKEEVPSREAAQIEEDPDYRISLSEESKNAISELIQPQSKEKVDFSDEEAVQVAQQASKQLAQTNASISNQAIQNAVDLFT